MSAYATPQHEPSAQLRNLEQIRSSSGRAVASIEPSTGLSPSVDAFAVDASEVIDRLVDLFAERLAIALAERIGTNPGSDPDDWLDSREAAKYLGLHRDTLLRLAAARAIPAEQDGRGCKLFFHRAALDEWRRNGGPVRHLAIAPDAA